MKSISIIIPAHNEQDNILPIYTKVKQVIGSLENAYNFEILFVNDGSHDKTREEIEKLIKDDHLVKFLEFSKNFGKEMATTAGINACKSDACIMIDADLQHPAELIPNFIEKWQQGNQVVVGVRNESKSESMLKKVGSKLFYKIINKISDIEIIPNATDFRLLDQVVIREFNCLTERTRMTRALIDWLGFKRDYIYFDANERLHGTAKYSTWKLLGLAMNSFVSLSLVPLQLAGYLGMFITIISGFSGLYILIGKYFLHTHFASTFSDSENLAILLLFLVGIILMSLGLIALYIANIYKEVTSRPMYVIQNKNL